MTWNMCARCKAQSCGPEEIKACRDVIDRMIEDMRCMGEACPFVQEVVHEFEYHMMVCSKHGRQKIVSEERSWGYAGPLYFYRLECGCQEVDASDDVPEM